MNDMGKHGECTDANGKTMMRCSVVSTSQPSSYLHTFDVKCRATRLTEHFGQDGGRQTLERQIYTDQMAKSSITEPKNLVFLSSPMT